MTQPSLRSGAISIKLESVHCRMQCPLSEALSSLSAKADETSTNVAKRRT
jgi:hypothetical protein